GARGAWCFRHGRFLSRALATSFGMSGWAAGASHALPSSCLAFLADARSILPAQTATAQSCPAVAPLQNDDGLQKSSPSSSCPVLPNSRRSAAHVPRVRANESTLPEY